MSRQMLADLNVGDKATIPLVVISAAARKTKAGKDYLALELFDGVTKINGNYWEWTSSKVPTRNTVIDVTCTVTEWQGTRQLNIQHIVKGTAHSITEFVPQSGLDIDVQMQCFSELVDLIDDADLQVIVAEAFKHLREDWRSAPGAKGVHHAYTAGTLIHSVETAKIARAVAGIVGANVALCTAAALLHDIGKLWTYLLDGAVIDMTNEGKLFDHTFIGANFISNFADHALDTNNEGVKLKVDLLIHCVLAHHGQLQFGAAVPPLCLEAFIVNMADGVSTRSAIIGSAAADGFMWTERIWALDNKPHLQADYVRRIFEYESGITPSNPYGLPGEVKL